MMVGHSGESWPEARGAEGRIERGQGAGHARQSRAEQGRAGRAGQGGEGGPPCPRASHQSTRNNTPIPNP